MRSIICTPRTTLISTAANGSDALTMTIGSSREGEDWNEKSIMIR